MTATGIRMKRGCEYSDDVRNIDSIYVTGFNRNVPTDELFDYLKEHPMRIVVDCEPNTFLIAEKIYNEKYVHSSLDESGKDILMKLPRT